MRASRAFWILSSAMAVAVGFGLSRVAHVDAASPISNPQVRLKADTTYAGAAAVRVKADRAIAIPAANAAAQAPIDRSLIDRYCVSCHNQRLKTGDVVLETVDFGQIAGNQELLEKVVHKLRAGQMPPAGARRPDKAAINTFASS